MRNRRAGSARLGALAGTAVVSCGLISVFLSGTHATAALAAKAKNPCAHRPAAAANVVSALSIWPTAGLPLAAAQPGALMPAQRGARSVAHSATLLDHRTTPGAATAAVRSRSASGQAPATTQSRRSRSASTSGSPSAGTATAASRSATRIASPSGSAGPTPQSTFRSPSPDPSPHSPSPSTTKTPTPTASPTKTNTPTPTTSPRRTSTPTPTASPTRSKSPSPSPSPSRSKSPSPSPSPTKTQQAAQLCVSVQPFANKARVRAGSTATYIVWVWSTHADAKAVTVDAAIRQLKHVGAPRFSVCPSASGSTCALGNLPKGQADELRVQVKVRKAAHAGRHVKLTAKAKAKGATSGSAAAAFKVVSVSPSPSPTPTPTPPAPAPPLPPLPPAPDPAAAVTSPTGLFPTVSPQPSTSLPVTRAAPGHRRSRAIRATSASDPLPLNPRLIGGQLAGLAVLAMAITIAIARLSLRPQRPEDGSGPPAKE